MADPLLIQDLYIYPIKSLAGIRLTAAKVAERGFELDRRWMLVDESGTFLTQRKFPLMAQFKVEIAPDGLIVYPDFAPKNKINIPFEAEIDAQVAVRIWDDQMVAQLVGTQIDEWFSELLNKPVRLVKMPLTTHREISPKYAENGEAVSFADAMPYLIIGQESLNDINARLDSPVPMDRFRPNIVFSGGSAFAEDSWKHIRIGEVDFRVTKPCARCVMITIDQATSNQGKEPLKTLSTYRKVGNKVLFGQNMMALKAGEVKVGDTVQSLSEKANQ